MFRSLLRLRYDLTKQRLEIYGSRMVPIVGSSTQWNKTSCIRVDVVGNNAYFLRRIGECLERTWIESPCKTSLHSLGLSSTTSHCVFKPSNEVLRKAFAMTSTWRTEGTSSQRTRWMRRCFSNVNCGQKWFVWRSQLRYFVGARAALVDRFRDLNGISKLNFAVGSSHVKRASPTSWLKGARNFAFQVNFGQSASIHTICWIRLLFPTMLKNH